MEGGVEASGLGAPPMAVMKQASILNSKEEMGAPAYGVPFVSKFAKKLSRPYIERDGGYHGDDFVPTNGFAMTISFKAMK